MRYPKLPVRPLSRETVEAFGGYNRNLRIGDGEFRDMENLTSDYYPVLSPRGRRGVYARPNDPKGLIAKDSLCYIDGTSFVINEYPVDLGLTEGEKQLVSMGAYVIILPDKKWINTLDITQHGDIEASFSSTTDVAFYMSTATGDPYRDVTTSDTEPKDPANMALWIDTGSTPHSLKQYSASAGMWVTVATTYVKISTTGIGKAFEQYDGVTISGVLDEKLQSLNTSATVWAKGDDFIVITGLLEEATTQLASEGPVKVERKMPYMDYVVEAGNRIWGCRYGIASNGSVVNEIYASKLGDFKNWNCFMGVSTDSWAAQVGTDGPFTGAVTHLGFPLFFKENCLHKVYISDSGAHGIQDTACRGVQRGCHKSLAIVNETLYYMARSGICAYDGSLPEEVSQALGAERYGEAVGGAHGNKYYVSMLGGGKWNLFVLDTLKGMWHREDSLRATDFCSCRGEMYAIDADTKKIVTLLGSGEQDREPVRWMAQTGPMGMRTPDSKYISRLSIRMQLELGTTVHIYAQYDRDQSWTQICSVRGTDLRTFSVPVRPRRCDHMTLRFEGSGDCKIFAVTKTYEQGSDRA